MKKYFLMILVVLSLSVKAQDPSFSQFYNVPSYYNPSFSSYYPGINTSLVYRNLWTKLPGNFTTEYFNFNYSFCKGNGFKGLGLSVFDDKEGLNWLETRAISINPTGGFTAGPFAANLSISVQLNQKTINWKNLIFTDQLDEVLGIVNTSAFVVPQNTRSKITFDPGWSISGKYQPSNANPFDRHLIITAGYAMHHANEPDQSFTGYTSKLPRKSVYQATAYIPINWFNITPGFIYETQGKYKTVMAGSNFDTQGFAIGLWYRSYLNSDAIVFYTSYLFDPNGQDRSKLQISYSYDMTVSSQKMNTGGSHEVTLSYKILNTCGKSSKVKPGECPPEFQRYRPKLHYDHRGWH